MKHWSEIHRDILSDSDKENLNQIEKDIKNINYLIVGGIYQISPLNILDNNLIKAHTRDVLVISIVDINNVVVEEIVDGKSNKFGTSGKLWIKGDKSIKNICEWNFIKRK